MPRLVRRTTWEPRFFEARPHFAPIAEAAARFARFEVFPTADDCTRAVPELGVRFVAALPVPARRRRTEPIDAGALYDGQIVLSGVVPTRSGSWHDFFNVLVWASFPRAKEALHRRQYEAHAARVTSPVLRLPGARTREQDALAMVDEGGLLLLVAEGHEAAVDEAITTASLESLVALVQARRAAALVFGHALYEHLVSSDADVRACSVVLHAHGPLPEARADVVALADARLVERLANKDEFLTPSRAPAVPLADALF